MKRQESTRPSGMFPSAFCLCQTPSGVLGLSRDAISKISI